MPPGLRPQRFFVPSGKPSRPTWGRFRIWKPREGVSLMMKLKTLLHNNDVEAAQNYLTPLLRARLMNLPDMANMFIEMFGKHGCTYEARLIFDKIQRKNNSTWYFLIQAYTLSGVVDEARRLYEQMPKRSPLFSVTQNLILGCYIDNDRIPEARKFFDNIAFPATVTWGIMFSSYVEHGYLQEAKLFLEKTRPKMDSVARVIMITAYAQNGYLLEAKQVLDEMPEKTPIAYSVVVIAFARYGYMSEANKLLREAPLVDGDAWNVVITAYAQKGHHEQACILLKSCPFCANQITYIAMMLSYARQGNVKAAEDFYSTMNVKTVAVKNALLTTYALNKKPAKAYEVFRTTEDRNVVTWTNMIYSYLVSKSADKARNLFDEMPFRSVIAHNALSTVYALGGQIREARNLYKRRRNVLSTSVMLLGYARLKQTCPAFEAMNLEGTKPDEFTFTCLLVTCGHLGLWKNTRDHFASMFIDFDIVPSFEHYFCLIQALAFNGKLDEAEEVARDMPFIRDLSTIATLASASKIHGDLQRQKRVLELVKMPHCRNLAGLKGPLVTPGLLLDSILSVSYMQDELVIKKRIQSYARYLNYLSIPSETEDFQRPVVLKPFG